MQKSHKQLRVMVLMGGPSSEHEVSLNSGRAVVANLDQKKYLVQPVMITRKGEWIAASIDHASLPASIQSERDPKKFAMVPSSSRQTLQYLPESFFSGNMRPDVVFVAMHGAYGEDGRIQGLLDYFDIPYTGSGVLASALAMDKPRAADVLRAAGLSVPNSFEFGAGEWRARPHAVVSAICKLGLPIVLKPTDLGSSVGVSIVQTKPALSYAVKKALRVTNSMMAQRFIRGMEVHCGVLEDAKTGVPFALPPTEIIPKSSTFFDYTAKYTPGGAEEITPARLSKNIIKKVQETALATHRALGASGMSRTDMITAYTVRTTRPNGQIYILELNTIPGMTQTSLLPQGAAAANIPFSQMIDLVIASALRRRRGLLKNA